MRTPKTITGQWVKVSATFTMPDNIIQDFYDNSVLGVGLGAINEIRDAGFTQGNKYWGWSNGHAIDPNLKYKGYNSFSMHTMGQDQDRWWGAFGQFIDCSPSEDIVISAYFNTDGKVPIDNGVYIEMEFW